MRIIVSRDKLEAAELALAEAKKRDEEVEVSIIRLVIPKGYCPALSFLASSSAPRHNRL